MFRVWSPRPSIAVSPLADFTPSPNTRLFGLGIAARNRKSPANVHPSLERNAALLCLVSEIVSDFLGSASFLGLSAVNLPFVQNQSENNSKMICLCVYICHEIDFSPIHFICYAACAELQRTVVSAFATETELQNHDYLYLHLLWSSKLFRDQRFCL